MKNDIDARQPVLIDMTPYLDDAGTVFEAIEEVEAEERAAIAEAAAEVAAEAERTTQGIRAMITATLPAGAAGRWAATLGTDTPAEESDTDDTDEQDDDEPALFELFPGRTWEERVAEEALSDDEYADEASVPEVDVDALQMSPMVRAMVVDLADGPWHYQTRKGAHNKGLVTDVKATALTELGERVRVALLAS